MRRGLLVALAGAALAGGAPAQEKPTPALRLAFEDTTEAVREKGTKGSPLPVGPQKTRVVVWLTKSGFTTETAGLRRQVDFDRARIREWEVDDKAATDLPLEAEVDALRLEFFNRIQIATILEKAGEVPPGFDLLELETLFRMEKEEGALRSRIECKESKEGLAFHAAGAEVVRVAWDARPLDPTYAPSWRRFLRNTMPMHPVVLARVGEANRLPSELTFRWRNAMTRTSRTLRLLEVGDGTTSLPAVPGAVSHGVDPLGRALAAAESAKMPLKAQAVAKSMQLQKEGGALDAFLALMAYSLASGDKVQKEMQALLESAVARSEVQEFVTRLNEINDKEKAAAAGAWLAELQAGNLRYGWLLAVWRANACSTLGQLDAARDLFLAMLTEHPEVVGAWHDLGWIYSRQFYAPDAWRCWEAGFKIAPHHPMLEPVSRLRESLRADHPAFFR